MSLILKPPLPRLRRSHPLTNGLVFAAPFYEGSGGILHDISGRDNHGTLTTMDPNTDWVRSPYGWVLDFDGTNDHVIIGTGSIGRVISGAVGVTVVARVLANSLNNNAIPNSVFSQFVNGTSNGVFLGVRLDGSIRFGGRSQSADALQVNNFGTGATTGQWMHIAGVLNINADIIQAYLNGAQAGSDFAATFGASSYTLGTPTTQDVIAVQNTPATSPWNGRIESLIVYNRVLAPSEIAELYFNPAVIYEPPKKYWLFGVSTQIFNETGNLSAIPSLTSSETLDLPNSGNLATAPSLSADQTITLIGVGDLSGSPALVGDQTVTLNESGDLGGSPAFGSGETLAVVASANLSAVPTLVAVHTYTSAGGGTLSGIPSLTGDNTLTLNVSGLLSAIPSLVASVTAGEICFATGISTFVKTNRAAVFRQMGRTADYRKGRTTASYQPGRCITDE